MAGITAGSALRRISWKCKGYWDIFPKQNTKIFPALKFYSTGKNGDVKEKNYIQRFQKLESEQRESLSSRLQKGINIGTWKFYVQDLVLKNLKPDIVPLSYRMCYRSGLETYANFGILTAALTSVFLSIAVPFYLFHQGSTPVPFEVAGFFFGGVICTYSLFSVSRQVPLRIYYSEECDDFLVYMPKYIPYAAKKLNIQPGHVKPPTGTSDYLPWINLQHTHTQTKQKMLIDGEKFILPMYYNKLMGYH